MGGAILLALGLRLYGLADQDYWLDELHSLANSAGRRAEFEAVPHGVIVESYPRSIDLTAGSRIVEVWCKAREDTHPPLYFILLLVWRRWLGDGEFAVRLLSVLFSIASILPASLILYEFGRFRASIIAAFLLAVSFTHLHMAQEARPYSMAMFFVCVSYWAMVRLGNPNVETSKHQKVKTGAGGEAQTEPRLSIAWLVLYGASSYLAVMTHYFAALALLGQAPFVLLSMRGRVRRAVILSALAAAALFAITWGSSLGAQLTLITDQTWLLDQRPDHLARTVVRLLNPPIRILFAHERFLNIENFHRNAWIGLAGLFLLLCVLGVLRRKRCADAIGFLGWYFVPLAALAVVDLSRDQQQLLSHVRYLSTAAPAWVALLALAVDGFATRARWTAIAVVVIMAAFTLHLPTQQNPSNRLAAKLIGEQALPGDLLIYDAQDWPTFWAARIYHNVAYNLPAHSRGVQLPFVLLRERPGAELLERFAGYHRVMVVAPHPPGEKDPNPLPERFTLVNQTGYVDLVGFIYLFERRDGG